MCWIAFSLGCLGGSLAMAFIIGASIGRGDE